MIMKTGFEDKRIELTSGYPLNFPGMDCIVDECIGKGSNAIVYLGHYADHRIKDLYHRILIKELYPFDGEENDGISRNSNGEIIVPSSSEAFFAVHKKSYLSGNRFHLKLLADNPGELDSHINTFEYNNTLYSILEFTGGRSMLHEIQKGEELSLNRIIKWMKGLLTVLTVFHDAGYLHLDISLDNILLTGEGETERVTLIDYNSIISLSELAGEGDIILSVKKGKEYAAPEVLHARREEIGPWTDIYSVTAVFFHLLFNRGRSAIERKNRFKLPDQSTSTVLEGQNSVVLDMISTILAKGFKASAKYRYQTVEQMKIDFAELEERIACRGITHWALWQKGNEYVTDIIKKNTAWHFIMDPQKIYPLKAQPLITETDQSKEIMLLDDSFRKELISPKPVLLLGSGGMGKTTFLLRLAYNRDKNYTAKSIAVICISLFGWKNGDKTFIQDKILEKLDFSHEKLESARRDLRHLLQKTLPTKKGELPGVLLCLDGLNEASGDISPLLDEIQELNALSGVKIVLTSRSEIAGDEFNRWVISRLTQEDVQTILRQRQIPEPENMEIMELLHIPIMLSMYIEALNGRKILKLDNKDELLEEYFSVLIAKEARNSLNLDTLDNVQDSPAYFGAQVAVKYILPEIAALLQKQENALSEKVLYHCVEKCYRYLNQKAFTGVFEKWIGHTSELKLGAKNADEWYGKVVQEILWKKLGLLVKDMDRYRISHQIIEEYMVQKSKEFHVQFDLEKKKLKNRRRIFSGAVVMTAILLFGLYNYYMSSLLRTQNKEVLKNESVALAYASESKLKEGDRTAALSLAFQALPTEDNDRPYVADAENALIDALYIYEESGYKAMHKINLGAGSWKNAITEDGQYIVALDKNGYVRCYNTHSEELLWSYSSFMVEKSALNMLGYRQDRVSMMSIVESQNAVLLSDNSKETVLLSLETGKEIWKLNYSELDKDISGELYQAILSADKKILALGYVISKNVAGNNIAFKMITFVDVTTGKLMSKTNLFPSVFSTNCSFTENGAFSDDNAIYASLMDNNNSVYELILINPLSGMIQQTVWIKKDARICNKDECLQELYYLPSNAMSQGGFLLYIHGYDQDTFDIVNSVHNVSDQIAYLEKNASEYSYNGVYDVQSSDTDVPDLITLEDYNFFLYSDQILMTDRRSGEVLSTRDVLDNNIMYYLFDEDEERITIITKDGRQQILSLPNLDYISYSMSISDFELYDAVGEHRSKKPFALIQKNDINSIVLYEWYQNDDIRKTFLTNNDTNEMFLLGRIFTLPNRKEILYLKENASDNYKYDNTGMIFNQQGKLVDQFEFETDASFILDQLQISEDDNYLISNQYIYDMALHQLTDLSELSWKEYPYAKPYRSIISTVTKSGIQSISLFENGLQVLKNVGGAIVDIEYDGEIKLSSQPIYSNQQLSRSHFENVTLGKNSIAILCCFDDTKTMNDTSAEVVTDYYLVYFIEENRWNRIENKSKRKGYPNLAIANESAIFAACDSDEIIRIYDANNGNVLYEYPTSSNIEAIEGMQFILDDRYLVIFTQESGSNHQIMRIEDGQIVYQHIEDSSSSFAHLVIYENAEKNRIYLFDNEYFSDAVELDTEQWTEIAQIKGLSGILSEDMFVVRNRYTELQFQHRDDLNVLISKAIEILKSKDKEIQTE